MSFKDIMDQARENSEFVRNEMKGRRTPNWADNVQGIGAIIVVVGLLLILLGVLF